MEMEDLISIIIPVYNVKDYLEECIQSVLNQTYKNLEIIIVDDGSTDGSELICNNYKDVDSRITVIHQSNMGLSAARNAGLQACNGKYISFIDSDDYIENNYVEELYKLIKKNNVRISICKIKALKDGKFYPENVNLLNNNGELLQGRDCVFNTYVWNKLYDIEVWKNIEFETEKWYEDSFIMYQIMYSEKYVAVSNKELYVYRKRAGSISSDVFDISKSKDFLDASNQRMIFFESREKYLYDVCIDKILGAIRKYFCALYITDKTKYKNEMRTIVKEYRRMYNSRFLKTKFGLENNLKILFFYIMPNIYAKVKYKRYLNKM